MRILGALCPAGVLGFFAAFTAASALPDELPVDVTAIPPAGGQLVCGQIEGFLRTTLRDRFGLGGVHVLLQLRQRNGAKATLDVGPEAQMAFLQLAAGQWITLCAHEGSLAGWPILFADRIVVGRAAGTALPDGRRDAPAGGTAGPSLAVPQATRDSSTGPVRVRGEIAGFREIPVWNSRGQRGRHALLKLTLTNGDTLVADVGAAADLPPLPLARGARIAVRGRCGRIDGRPVLFATSFHTGRKTVNIPPPPSSRTGDRHTVRGTVERIDPVEPVTDPRLAGLHELRLTDGRNLLIKVPPADSSALVPQVGLFDQVILQGRRLDDANRTILAVDSIQLRGQERVDPMDALFIAAAEGSRESLPDSAIAPSHRSRLRDPDGVNNGIHSDARQYVRDPSPGPAVAEDWWDPLDWFEVGQWDCKAGEALPSDNSLASSAADYELDYDWYTERFWQSWAHADSAWDYDPLYWAGAWVQTGAHPRK